MLANGLLHTLTAVLEQGYLRCGLQTSGVSLTWELVRTADPQAPPEEWITTGPFPDPQLICVHVQDPGSDLILILL